MLKTKDAMDVIMDITFSQNLGFLDTGTDVNGFLAINDKNQDSAALVNQSAYLVN